MKHNSTEFANLYNDTVADFDCVIRKITKFRNSAEASSDISKRDKTSIRTHVDEIVSHIGLINKTMARIGKVTK